MERALGSAINPAPRIRPLPNKIQNRLRNGFWRLWSFRELIWTFESLFRASARSYLRGYLSFREVVFESVFESFREVVFESLFESFRGTHLRAYLSFREVVFDSFRDVVFESLFELPRSRIWELIWASVQSYLTGYLSLHWNRLETTLKQLRDSC